MSIPVDLEDGDLELAREVAERICANKRRQRTPSKRFAKGRTDVELTTIGNMGEIAVARWSGGTFNANVLSGSDRRIDGKFPDGRTYDAKTAQPGARWFLPGLKIRYLFKADLGIHVLETHTEALLQIDRFVSRDDFIDKAQVVDLGHGPCLAMAVADMQPIEELKVGPPTPRACSRCRSGGCEFLIRHNAEDICSSCWHKLFTSALFQPKGE